MKIINQLKFQVMKLKAQAANARDKFLCYFNPIKTQGDYFRALWDITALWEAKQGTPEGEKLNRLALYVDDYERKNVSNFWGKQ